MIEAKGNTIREAAWDMIQKINAGEDPREIVEKEKKSKKGKVTVKREETGDGLWQLRYFPSEPAQEKSREEKIAEKMRAAGKTTHEKPTSIDRDESEMIGFDLKHRVVLDIIKAERDPLTAIEELIARSTNGG